MKKLYILGLFFLYSPLCIAQEKQPDFAYKGKPIDPICILESNVKQIVNLDNCEHSKSISIEKFNSPYSYQYHTNKDMIPGSASYKYLGYQADAFVVHAEFIGGLTSRLNFIKYYKIAGNKLLMIFSGPSGDRSFGGIYNSYFKDNSLYYDMALTPRLFMMNFNMDAKYNNEIDKLVDCAVCRFATLHYKDHKLQSVTIANVKSYLQENKYQQCFNHLHNKKIKANKLEMTPKEAKQFANSFINQCIK
jgi:hypothetical protein